MTFYKRNSETLKIQDFDTVLFDMDGTLLDLHFDNEFWLKSLVNAYASARGIRACNAKTQLQGNDTARSKMKASIPIAHRLGIARIPRNAINAGDSKRC